MGGQVFNSLRLRSLARQQSDWRAFRQEQGWVVAEPAFAAPIHHFQGYILNLFDLVDQQHVADDIVLPLTHAGNNLDAMLTVPKYVFPGMLGE